MVCAIVSALFHFDENPVVITIFVCIAVTILLFVGNEKIIVYPDRFIYCHGSLMGLFDKKLAYYFKDIKEITFEGIYSWGLDNLTDRLPLHVPDPTNKLYILMKSGKEKEINSRIYKNDLREAVQHIIIQLNRKENSEGI